MTYSEYYKRWVREHREHRRAYQKAWREARGPAEYQVLWEALGGYCSVCGAHWHTRKLLFSYKDPKEQSFEISAKISAAAPEKLLEEAKKCVLLCIQCWEAKHGISQQREAREAKIQAAFEARKAKQEERRQAAVAEMEAKAAQRIQARMEYAAENLDTWQKSEQLREAKSEARILGQLPQQQRRRANRDFFIALLGGKCVNCGFSKYKSALQFDHVDAKKKTRELATLFPLRDREKIWAEVQKCQLLCANCHWEKSITAGDIGRKRRSKESA